MKQTKPKKRPMLQLIDMPALKPSKYDAKLYHAKAIAAEPTGKGDTLIIEGFFGRMFRSDVGCVEDELEQFVSMYEDICQKFDEDPAHEFYEVMSYNDLYSLHGLMPGAAQGSWGYTNTKDYRVLPLEFRTTYVTEGAWVDLFGEPYFYYCPKEHCVPDPCYLEV